MCWRPWDEPATPRASMGSPRKATIPRPVKLRWLGFARWGASLKMSKNPNRICGKSVSKCLTKATTVIDYRLLKNSATRPRTPSGGFMLNRNSVWTRAGLLFFLFIVVAVPAIGQTFYGSLVGVVSDAQGGVIPGATVVLVNTATNERRELVSDADGSVRFLNLVPATYRLEVELTGFQRFVRDGIEVNVNSTPRVEVKLELGNLSETITVAGEAAVLQTEDASVGLVVQS